MEEYKKYKEEELEFEGQDEVREEEKETNEIEEYDLTSTPNDFNILTLGSFIDSGAITIPGFQRNYVWDLKKASRLIESLILGLPVPQLFLYEQDRNKFSVIDGQQRLMTIYYFIKGRFPKPDKRPEIREIFTKNGEIPSEIFHNDEYFRKFKLYLPSESKGSPNKYHNLSYDTLGELKTPFDLRPIRNVIVKQNAPKDDDSSVYEIFNRLNSGGINLKPQEIRSSLYHSNFYNMLHRLNTNSTWRKILKKPSLDLHLRDFELLLRAYSFIYEKNTYSSPLAKFLNTFSKNAKKFTKEEIELAENVFIQFINKINNLPDDIFINERTNRFNAFLFEAVFFAVCKDTIANPTSDLMEITVDKINSLESNSDFISATQEGTTRKDNVDMRLNLATVIFNN